MAQLLSDEGIVKLGGRVRRARVERILHAAEKLFAANGFDGTTTADIANLAELPKANVYYYFGTKEKIYLNVLENILNLWIDKADIWIVPEHSPREAFTNYIKDKIALARDKPEASRIYANELLRGAPNLSGFLHITLRSRVVALSQVIETWVAQGKMRRVDPVHLFSCIWAMTQTYADFSVQIAAISGKLTLDQPAFLTASETISEMIIRSYVIETTENKT